jgi:hypothetical protein
MADHPFVRRRDLCENGITDYWWAKDLGGIIRRGRLWWASNDSRRQQIGVVPNAELAQPTLGPFATFEEARTTYVAAIQEMRASYHALVRR